MPSDIRLLQSVVAIDEEGGMGKGGLLPWNHPEDLAHFKHLTSPSANLIMGHRTYLEILGRRQATLKATGKIEDKMALLGFKRLMHVLSSDPSRQSPYVNVRFHLTAESILTELRREFLLEGQMARLNFVIGGPAIFTLFKPYTKIANITLIKGVHQCDVFLPKDYTQGFSLQTSFGGQDLDLLFQTYSKELT
jgi:dihydrofolate reductase